MVPSSSILDAGSLHILDQLKYGKINIRQAAELLKVEPTILAYELAAKVTVNGYIHTIQLLVTNITEVRHATFSGHDRRPW